MLTALRPGSIRKARWSWYNTQEKILNIPGAYMKNGEDFRCPLPTQAIQALDDLKILSRKTRLNSHTLMKFCLFEIFIVIPTTTLNGTEC